MKKSIALIVVTLALLSPNLSFAWSRDGHHMVAEIAFQLLSPQAKQKLLSYLNGTSVNDAATWMDDIRGNASYNYLTPTHYINLEKGRTYSPSGKPDLYTELTEVMKELENINGLTKEQAKFDLEVLMHLVGDLHQPLHDGYGEDKGGNSFQVNFNGKGTNLHSLYDHVIIDNEKITTATIFPLYSRYSKTQVNTIETSSPITWINEARTQLPFIYSFEGHIVTQSYADKAKPIIETQILNAGMRLSYLLEKYLAKTNPAPVKETAVAKPTSGQTYTAAESANHINETIMVCDKVFGTRFLENSGGQPTFLNLGSAYPNSPFTIVIFGSDRTNFKDAPEKLFDNKKVCATGLIKEYKGKPEMIIKNNSEIKIVE
jgi:hypothetical protein